MFENFELDYTTLSLTLVGSAIMLGIVWFNPLWQQSLAYGLREKIILSVALPIVTYPIIAHILNK